MANKKALVIYNGIVKQMQSGDTVDPSGLSATSGLWTLNASDWIAASSNYPNVSIPGNFNVDGDMTVTGSMIVNASTLYLGDNQLGNQSTDTQLFVGNITASGPFTISDATSPFVARGTASLDGTLDVGGAVVFRSTASIDGHVIAPSAQITSLDVATATVGDLWVTSNASIDGTVDVGGALVGRSTASLDSTLDVGGHVTAPSAQITSLDVATATA
ncbi:unnamed protein product, partial [marine sediment metagenome]